MDEERTQSRRRRVRGFAAGFLLLVGMTTVYPLAASAQLPTSIIANPYEDAKTAATEAVAKPFQVAFMTVIWNFMQFVSQRIAYDAAVALATMGNGEEPLINLEDPQSYFIGLGEDVAGAAVDALSQTLEAVNIHFNLCAPQAPAARLVLQLGIKSMTQRPEPVCDFQSLTSNWQGFVADSFGDDNPDQFLLSNFAQAINPRTTDLTAGITLYTQVIEDEDLNKSVSFGKYLSDHNFKDATDVITGNVKTPANIIDETWKRSYAPSNTQDQNRAIFNWLISAKDLWGQLGLSALSMFTNTFLSKFTDRVYSGLFDVQIDNSSPFDVASTGFNGGVQAVEDHFRTLLAFSPTKLDSYNMVSEFTTCPGTTTRGLDNCVMDSNFATAVGAADSGDPFTVQEAIDEGLIGGDWPLISPTDSRNVDSNCYTYGFCYANLVRMRLARVIPDGWELAASLQSGSSTDTLQTVIDAFDDETSKYYHLIDPNWVLKYPTTQCNVLAPGQLVSDIGTDRGIECVDAPSCIREDASGTCVGGYGYCAREANTWNFRGTECPEQYATCLSFDNGNGVNGSWLLNTADTEGCDADNAGCLWYSTQKEETDGAFAWPNIDDVPTLDVSAGTYLSRLYVNNNVETCDAEDAGCTRVIQKTSDVALNLVLNPSFETDDDGDSIPDHWALTGASAYSADAGEAQLGSDAADAGKAGTSGIIYQTDLPIQQSTFYTLSFYAAQETSASNNSATVYAVMASEDGSATVDLSGSSYETANCSLADLDSDGSEETIQMTATPASDSYERFTCTFTSPTFTDSSLGARVQYLDFISTGLLIDGVQLEAGEDVSDYREGYGQTIANLDPQYFKLPPSYLGCTGNEATDPEECSSYAPVCAALDVGCDLYTPENGDPSVPGIVNDGDSCPSTCVGYDTFKQEPTNYEPAGDFPVYFIPSTAVSCSETYVGCDEFTNLADESLEYYTYLRACLTPEQTSAQADYYTWEGSDLEGFQLKSWSLLDSDLSSSDDWSADAHPESAPCTSWTTTSNSIVCNDSASSLAVDFSCNEHDDIFSDPDCREFYDAEGNIHYRRFSDTVTVSDSCADYRKTTIAGDTSVEQETNCTEAGGYWNGTIGECRFYGLPEESTSCPAEFNGCREYTGGTGRNSSIVYSDDVEDEDVNEYTATNATVEVSNESIATDGHSIHITAGTSGGYLSVGNAERSSTCTDTAGCAASEGSLGFSCTVANGSTDCGELVDELASGKTYVLSFWAKAGANGVTMLPKFIEESGSGTGRDFNTVTLSTAWERYTVGPLDTSDFANFDDTAELAFVLPASGSQVYVDTITLRQTEEAITVVKDSWNTPAECDETPEGASSPQYYLGCQQYSDSSGTDTYLKSFTRLCSENKVGCDAFYNTESSDSPYAAVYNLSCEYGQSPSTAYRPATAAPVIVTSNTTCAVDGTTYCTIEAGESSCEFTIAEGAVPRDVNDVSGDAVLPYEDLGSSYGMKVKLGPDARVVAPDSLTYFVADTSYACDSGAMGCTAVGLPTFSADQTRVESWTDTYLLDVVDSYSDILCSEDALFCDAWDTTQDGTYYFKNPETKTCEYRTGVSIDGAEYTGWFRSGTDQFCYGTGTCTVSGSACQTDSDCTGSTDELVDSCAIDTGTYLVGGTESAMWRNGDSDFDGWTGECSSQYDLCSEFIDPVDVDQDAGEFYDSSAGSSSFFLNNDLLDESNLSSAKRCNGQVSQKKGCVLFENTTNAELNYNASASYNLSVHADQFYSDSTSYDLVDPVSCPDGGGYTALDGTSYDVCASRCAYQSVLVHPYDDYTTSDYTFTTSCLTDVDCPSVKSDGGDAVNGSCESGTFVGADSSSVTVPALENDTNEIQKVELDRACAEWLSCNSTTKVWDENNQEFVNVCDSIGLCNEYNSLGETTSCANWVVDAVPSVLTAQEYQNRDVSWYGHDYSGFSIPNTVLASHLVQENVNPARWCAKADGTVIAGDNLPYIDCSTDDTLCDSTEKVCASTGESCTSDIDCPDYDCDATSCVSADEDFRLVLDAGACDTTTTDNGESCTIGFCEDTGSPCSTSSDCNSGAACGTGYCYYSLVTQSCETDADCAGSGEFSTCYVDGGYCQRQTSEVCTSTSSCTDTDGSAGPPGCVQAAKTQAGTCVNNNCLATPADDNNDGKLDPFNFDDAETLTCRAWPETKAPFGNEVIKTWVDSATLSQTPVTDSDDRPYQTLSTFEDVNTCAGGQTCDCAYDAVSYGTNTLYFDQGAADAPSYLCVGGNYDGAACDESNLPQLAGSSSSCEDGGGTCTYQDGDQTKIGMQGFCLQRDTALTMNGDPNQAPCLAWLPIDRASGSTDLFGKATEAGYPLTDTFYCAEPALYADLGPSYFDTDNNISACAEHEGATPGSPQTCEDNATSLYDCADSVQCPEDYFAIMGRCLVDDGKEETGDGAGTLAEGCYEPFTATAGGYGTDDDNDCPFVCVPNNATKLTDDGNLEACELPDALASDSTLDVSFTVGNATGINSTPVYTIEAEEAATFDTVADYYQTCRQRGVAEDAALYNNLVGFSAHTGVEAFGDDYRFLFFTGDVYPACKTVVQTSDTTQGNKAWTDRVLFSGSAGGFTIDDAAGDVSSLFYAKDTEQNPFGTALDPNVQNTAEDAYPVPIASCLEQTSAPTDLYKSYVEAQKAACSGTPCIDLGSYLIEDMEIALPTGTAFSTCSTYEAPAALGSGGNASPPGRSFVNIGYTEGTGYLKDDFNFVGEAVSDAIDRIGQIFADTGIAAWTWNDSAQQYETAASGWDTGLDTVKSDTGDGFTNGRPPSGPVVRSVGSTCVGQYCREGADDKFTVNGEDSNDLTGAGGTFFADLKFFVEANPNQLPIRRVIVDWADEIGGDYAGSITGDNYYKNRRGLDSTNSQYCDNSNADNWGETTDACDSNYFNAQHYYTCSQGFINTLPSCSLDADGKLAESPCTTDGESCTYQPRVHIRDNWGWCTGTCLDSVTGVDGTNGCYDADGDITSSTDQDDECDLDRPNDSPFTEDDPWVYYDGVITIEP